MTTIPTPATGMVRVAAGGGGRRATGAGRGGGGHCRRRYPRDRGDRGGDDRGGAPDVARPLVGGPIVVADHRRRRRGRARVVGSSVRCLRWRHRPPAVRRWPTPPLHPLGLASSASSIGSSRPSPRRSVAHRCGRLTEDTTQAAARFGSVDLELAVDHSGVDRRAARPGAAVGPAELHDHSCRIPRLDALERPTRRRAWYRGPRCCWPSSSRCGAAFRRQHLGPRRRRSSRGRCRRSGTGRVVPVTPPGAPTHPASSCRA